MKLLPLGFPTFDLVPPYESGGAARIQTPLLLQRRLPTQPFNGYPAAAYTSFFQQWDPTHANPYQKNGLYEMYALSAKDSGLPAPPRRRRRSSTGCSAPCPPRVTRATEDSA